MSGRVQVTRLQVRPEARDENGTPAYVNELPILHTWSTTRHTTVPPKAAQPQRNAR